MSKVVFVTNCGLVPRVSSFANVTRLPSRVSKVSRAAIVWPEDLEWRSNHSLEFSVGFVAVGIF